MADFMVGLWSMPHKISWKWSWNDRVTYMGGALKRLAQEVASAAVRKQIPMNLPFQAIFLAPEYYFTARSDGTERTPLGELDRLHLEQQLYGLSKTYRNILVVPGSLHYIKDLVRPAAAEAQMKFNPATGKRDLPKTTPADRRKHVVDKLLLAAEQAQARNRPDVIHQGYAEDTKRVPPLLEVAEAFDVGARPRIVRNVVLLFLGGRRVAKYDKHEDYFEAKSSSPDDLAFIPGTQEQCPEIGRFRFGVEICCDHQCAILRSRNPANLDFHLVVSDVVKTNQDNMTMAEGGYFLHASAKVVETCVWRRDGGNLKDLTRDASCRVSSENSGGALLDIYRLPLPAERV